MDIKAINLLFILYLQKLLICQNISISVIIVININFIFYCFVFYFSKQGTFADHNGETQIPSNSQMAAGGAFNMEHFFLIGMQSVHSGDKEDRKFKFYYAKSSLFELGNCHFAAENSYDKMHEIPNSLQSLNWGK